MGGEEGHTRPHQRRCAAEEGTEDPDPPASITTITHCPSLAQKSQADIYFSCWGRTEATASYRLQFVRYWTFLPWLVPEQSRWEETRNGPVWALHQHIPDEPVPVMIVLANSEHCFSSICKGVCMN